ncbi:MAG: glycoside hydrolase family 16 protein [Bacteroidales bacterium]|nr:glycoside hydrolase family 16 protein [Bacteroidales bacterium]
MLNFRVIILLISLTLVSFSCKKDSTTPVAPFATVDFTYTVSSASENTLHFVANVTGSYELLEWTFASDSPVQGVLSTDHYFPFAGTYKVILTLWQKGEKVSATKTITIAKNDPNYNGPALLWSDEFDGSSLNTSNWSIESNVNFNNELQSYQASGNHQVAGGVLTITAKKVDDQTHYGSYTSARIISKSKKEFKYGRMEIRAKLPKGRGTWPAIWMLGSNIDATPWPTCGEIDIMEYVGYHPGWIKGSIHCASYNAGNSKGGDFSITKEEDYHVYGINWTADKIEYYVDDRTQPYFTYSPAVKTLGEWPFDQPFFFILNIAIGGTWGGQQGVDNTIFPVTMDIDWVRVYDVK